MYNDHYAAQSGLIKCMKEMVKIGAFDNKPIILTDKIFRAFEFSLDELLGCSDIVFLGFNNLILPRNTSYTGNLWLVDSTLEGGDSFSLTGNINYINSVKRTGIFSLAGCEVMDEFSLKCYRHNHSLNGSVKNRAVRLSKSDKLTALLKGVIKVAPKIDFLSYLNSFTNPDMVFNKTDRGYLLEGNLFLIGPLQFNIPDYVTINGTLYIINYVLQDWPNTMNLNGEIVIRSSYLDF